MAKAEKKISITAFDKVMKEQAVGTVTKEWFGHEIQIKHTLPLTDMLGFVNDVVRSCFQDEGGYMPELREFAIKSGILTRYANFTLPDKVEHQYALLYNTSAVETVMANINKEQFDDILTAIDRKLEYLCDSNISAIEQQARDVITAMDDMGKKMSELFRDVTPEDIAKVTTAIADGQFSEERLVKAYAENLTGKTNEPKGQA